VAPLHGFADVHDYYERSSGRQFLPAIRVPTLVIHSSDDPLMSPAVLPEASELSPAVRFERCRKGGHVGFIEGGSPWNPVYYLEHRIPDFLEGVLDGRLA
jgi:predicted alpha/beta-fold hydrolase